ncbi:MAG: hypothetical protein IKO15_03130 [Clostridiales bacterium]|nr:hypothetical protein [Clostridiales bacterium]
MNQGIWEILGIEPTDDVQAIKRAYSVLVHEVNPEDDPERFNELHDAYREALESAKNGTAAIEQTISDTEQILDHDSEEQFDFSDITSDYIPQDTTVDRIIEDLAFFRESNHLTSAVEMSNIPHRVKVQLSMTLFSIYLALADKSNDVSVWYTFFSEPLVKYCEQGGFDDWVLSVLPPDSVHKAKIKEIIDERFKAANDKWRVAVEASAETDKRNLKTQKKKILVCLVILFLLIVLMFVGLIIQNGNGLIVFLTIALPMIGIIVDVFVMAIIAGSNNS